MDVSIIRPRLNDYHNIFMLQDEVEFVIPFVNEDIPLYVDPFLLWKSPHQMDVALHQSIIQSFNHLGYLVKKGKTKEATNILVQASECEEVGLGTSLNRQGKRIGEKLANDILGLFSIIPELQDFGFQHIEALQFVMEGVSKDRISDIACSFISSHLVDFTTQRCAEYNIPMKEVEINHYNSRTHQFETTKKYLPVNPETGKQIWLVPKRWLRFNPFISPDEYFKSYFNEIVDSGIHFENKASILQYNQKHFDYVSGFIEIKERSAKDCSSDPLFKQIPVTSAKRTMSQIKKLPTGKTDNSDKKYEELVCKLLASLLYPHLDFAMEQSRTLSGSIVRDLVFYNNDSIEFFDYIFKTYGSRQIVFELKNVEELNRDHVNQTNGYLNDSMGRFGVIVTRNEVPKKIKQRLVDLWSGQRRCILVLTDADLELMVSIFEHKQRLPYEVLVKKYHEFKQLCPA